MMADDAEMDEEIERQLEAEARNNIKDDLANKMDDNVWIVTYFSQNRLDLILNDAILVRRGWTQADVQTDFVAAKLHIRHALRHAEQ